MHAFITTTYHLPPSNSPDILIINPDPSIGIEGVRQIQKFLSRKPIRGDKNTVIINQAHLLTIPAQNALLKTLEEPPGNSLIYLVTEYPDQLLPTILSRVQITDLPDHPDLPDLSKSKALLEKLQKSGVGERLKILEEAEFTRETALKFIDDLEYLIHQEINTPSPTSPPNLGGDHRGGIYNIVIDTRRYLRANCSVKLSLAHLAINL